VVECLLAKEEVASSNLVFRSIFFQNSRSKVHKSSQHQLLFTNVLLNDFLNTRPQGISPKSVITYHYTLEKFIGYPLTVEGINSYLSKLTCKNGKLKFYSCLRALFNWLYRNGRIPDNPIKHISPPKVQKKLLPAISHEQLQTLLNYCKNERDKALISLLWYSGMRISEAVNLKSDDFNWEEGTVIVLGKGNRYRKCIAGNGAVKQWFSKHDTIELNIYGAQTMLRRLKAESGIHCNAHSFRRGFCVHQVKSGLSTRVVQALGGWERITMVEHYSKSLSFDEALSVYKQANKPS
jgi:integrase/recombinase XerD